MKIATPKIDRRSFTDLLKQSQALAPFYTPQWIPGQQGELGQALLNIYLHMQEQILSRLNRVPDKNFVAFLDMMGMKLLPAQSAQAAVTFTLAKGTTEHVLVPKGTLLSGQAADGSGEVIFQTQKDLSVTPANLQGVFSYDAAGDGVYEHTQDEKDPKPFTVFNGANNQEHSFYLAHADLLNQKKPTKIKLDFLLAEVAGDGSDLKVVWEYYDGKRWVGITRFERDAETDEFHDDDGTRLFTRSGAMTLEKSFTGEIGETEVSGIKSRWIRCRLARALPGSTPIQLPEINNIFISVNPISAFAPDLAFNNDIPLELGEINLPLKSNAGIALRFENLPVSAGAKSVRLEGGANLKKGDLLEFRTLYDDVERRVVKNDPTDSLIILDIDDDEDTSLKFEYAPGSKVRLFTAIRPNENVVYVDSLEGLSIPLQSKITLGTGANKDVAYIRAIDAANNKMTLRSEAGTALPALKRPYIEGEILRITPKINPFGALPQIFDTFYIASDEAFSKKGAEIILHIESEWNSPPSGNDPEPNPILSWEYWNGKSWRGLRVSDTTKKFREKGVLAFTCPDDIEKVEVNSEEKFWIRVRIIDGDYGKELLVVPKDKGTTEVEIKSGKVHFPIISDLKIDYKNVRQQPQSCLTFNNLNYEDHTEDCNDETRVFAPFTIMPEQFSGLFLGFDKAMIGGPLGILFNVKEQFLGQDEQLKVLWFYWNGGAWKQLNVIDETENLTKIGLLEFVIGRDFAARKLFGKELFWLKGSVVEGEHPDPLEIKSLHPNTTYALQADVANNEIAGSGNGTANQEFTLQHPLVISQQVFVREPVLPPEDEQEAIRKEEGKDAIKEKKNELGETLEILVLWHEVDDFDDSSSKSRHYTIDQRLGTIKFGDSTRGMAPPVGADNIIVSYTFGGGKRGNVPVNAISGLKSAVPFVNTVTNPLAADGGSETETLDNVLIRGPLLLKNRNRAVTPEDFEAMARSASRKVARAKCLPNADEDKNEAPGWVTVMIVPDSPEAKPFPSQLLIKVVNDGLEKSSANVVSSPRHINVIGPDYTEIIVEATVVPVSLERAGAVEKAVRGRLNRYIHPLTGGPEETGGEFGQEICRSDIIALIEGTDDVDHVEKIILRANKKPYEGNVQLDRYSLAVSGEHEISISLGNSQGSFDPCKTSKTECAAGQEFTLVESQKK